MHHLIYGFSQGSGVGRISMVDLVRGTQTAPKGKTPLTTSGDSCVSASRMYVGEEFPAGNKDDAIIWLREKLQKSHAGGRITCRNSR